MRSIRLPGPVGPIGAEVQVPSSKSLTNRALIAAAVADGGRIERPLDCEDTRLLAEALRQSGWPVDWHGEVVVGRRRPAPFAEVDLGNSGTGSRLILGLLACIPGRFVVDGSDRLRQRPMAPLIRALEELGASMTSRNGGLPVEIEGRKLAGGAVTMRPEVSSQFVSSLLLAAPLMSRGIDLTIDGPVPSRPYLDLTRDVLRAFGATVAAGGDRWSVAPGGLQATRYAVEGDWSAVAFPAAAVAVAGGRVAVRPLSESSRQGDRVICEILERAGVQVQRSGETVTFRGPATTVFEVNLEHAPDAFPALSVVAAAGPPGTVLRGLSHLRHKECDRLSVMLDNLRRLGAGLRREGAILRVERSLTPGSGQEIEVTAAADHRIAMAMAVAGLVVGGVVIDDQDCVNKSFPDFWAMWADLVATASPSP